MSTSANKGPHPVFDEGEYFDEDPSYGLEATPDKLAELRWDKIKVSHDDAFDAHVRASLADIRANLAAKTSANDGDAK